MLELESAKANNLVIQYDDVDGKLNADGDKGIFDVCLVKCVHISYFLLFTFSENIKLIKQENEENIKANCF
jgi:hypothetical protein